VSAAVNPTPQVESITDTIQVRRQKHCMAGDGRLTATFHYVSLTGR